MRCIDLYNEAIEILGTYLSYNSRIKEECNFFKIVLQSVLNLFEGQIVVSKSLAI